MHSDNAPAVLTFLARKGGVGKSTLSTLLARVYAAGGLRVLFIDLDPQGTATEILAPVAPPDTAKYGHLLVSGASLLSLVCPCATPGISLLPTGEGLTVWETQLTGDPVGVLKVKRSLESVLAADVDLVIIDTSPRVGAFAFAALGMSTWAVIPTFCEEPSLRTLPLALSTVVEARALNPGISVLAIVANRLDRRTRHGLSALETLRSAFPEYIAKTVIPAAVSIIDCMRPGATIDDNAVATGALVELAEELLLRMNSHIDGTASPSPGCVVSSDFNAVDLLNAVSPVKAVDACNVVNEWNGVSKR